MTIADQLRWQGFQEGYIEGYLVAVIEDLLAGNFNDLEFELALQAADTNE